GDAGAALAGDEDLALAFGQGAVSGPERGGPQAGIADPLARHGAPDRKSQLVGRRILQHESGRAAFHGPPQEPRPAECRENEGPAGWERPAQLAGGRDAVTTGHLDVEQRDV